MQLEIINIAKINYAKVELNGITVIAGENNTGKSTVGKVLYAMTDFLFSFDQYIENDIRSAIYKEVQALSENLDVICKEYHYSQKQFRRKTTKIKTIQDGCIDELYNSFTNHDKETAQVVLDKYAEKHISLYQTDMVRSKDDSKLRINSAYEKLIKLWDLGENELGIGKATDSFAGVFNGQVNSLTDNKECAQVVLIDDYDKKSTIEFKDDSCIFVDYNTPIDEPAIFIENPRCLDLLNNYPRFFRRSEYYDIKNNQESTRIRLRQLLRPNNTFSYFGFNRGKFKSSKMIYKDKNKISDANITLSQKKLDIMKELLKKAVPGEYKMENFELMYREPEMEKATKLENLSTGLKSMVLIEQIISAGLLLENSIIILDEPEINLHPEWQLMYAEIIVLLQQIYDLKIVITTHSPYFLKAIRMYADKEGIKNKCKYYASESNVGKCKLSDVTDHLNILFRMLAEPLRELKKMENQNDWED